MWAPLVAQQSLSGGELDIVVLVVSTVFGGGSLAALGTYLAARRRAGVDLELGKRDDVNEAAKLVSDMVPNLWKRIEALEHQIQDVRVQARQDVAEARRLNALHEQRIELLNTKIARMSSHIAYLEGTLMAAEIKFEPFAPIDLDEDQ